MIWVILWCLTGCAILIWSWTADADFSLSDWPYLGFGIFLGPFTLLLAILFWLEDHPELYHKPIFKKRKKE